MAQGNPALGSPTKGPELESAIVSLNEDRAIFVIRIIHAAGKISTSGLMALIDAVDKMGIGM